MLVCCAPTYPPKLALSKKFYGHFEENIYTYVVFFFFQKSKNKDSFSQNYSFQSLFLCSDNVLLYCFKFNISYFEPYTSTNIANYKDIFLVPKTKMTYLPTTLKLMGRSTANKETFKGGLTMIFHPLLNSMDKTLCTKQTR